MTIRVAIVDDHPSTTWGMERLIATEAPRMAAAGVAHTMHAARELLQRRDADVVLLDLDMDGHNGAELITEFQTEQMRFLAFTGVRDEHFRDTAVRAGVRGVVSKQVAPDLILRAIYRVYEGELWLDRARLGRLVDTLRTPARTQDPLHALTPREREIVALVVKRGGASNKRLSEELQITESTLRNALSVIYSKVGVTNRLQLFALATSLGPARN